MEVRGHTLNKTSEEVFREDRSGSSEESGDVWKQVLIVIGIILGVLLLMYLIRRFIQGGFYTKKNRIDGKIVIVTGCNTGIGKETALELAKRGAKIYMACRDPKRCEDARLEIVDKSKNSNIYNRTLDLASLESIKKFVTKFKEEESKLDILINNAGVMAMPRNLTADGFEMQLGTNHLGHFYLTNLLLDRLKAAAPSRIVVLSSHAYMIGKINQEDFMLDKSYNKVTAYCQSKLANILFTKQLAKKLEGTGVIINCCHPGVVKTELSRHLVDGLAKKLLSPITYYFFKTPRAGAQTSLKLALDPDLEKSSGDYYSDCLKFPLLARAKDEKMAEWVWNKSEELTGLKREQPNDIHPEPEVRVISDTNEKF